MIDQDFIDFSLNCEYSYNVQGDCEQLGCNHPNNTNKVIFLGDPMTECAPTICPIRKRRANEILY